MSEDIEKRFREWGIDHKVRLGDGSLKHRPVMIVSVGEDLRDV